MFNGDPEIFSWWKTKMYSHVIGMDDELWVKVRKTQEGGGVELCSQKLLRSLR